jgi:coenzyme F420-reducing hydrogenase gamma subunit
LVVKKMITAILTIAFCLPSGLSLKCDISGECTQSYLVDEIITDDKKSCIEECRDNARADWFTYRLSSSFCELFANCTIIDDEHCNDCVSGEAKCPTSQCNLEGICEVNHGQESRLTRPTSNIISQSSFTFLGNDRSL